jgi:hypothetical protein
MGERGGNAGEMEGGRGERGGERKREREREGSVSVSGRERACERIYR